MTQASQILSAIQALDSLFQAGVTPPFPGAVLPNDAQAVHAMLVQWAQAMIPPIISQPAAPPSSITTFVNESWMIYGAQYSAYAGRNGQWSDASIWGPGIGAGAKYVPAGVTVTLSGNVVETDIIVAGSLLLTDGSSLQCRTLTILPGGQLSDPSGGVSPITTSIAFNGSLDPADTLQQGLGILNFGAIKLCGIPKDSQGRSVTAIVPGASITLSAPPAGWVAGDLILVGDTMQGPNPIASWAPLTEVLPLGSVSGVQVNLASPMVNQHPGSLDSTGKIEFSPKIANLSRSIKVFTMPGSPQRAHWINLEYADVDICHIEVKDLGRTTSSVSSPTNPRGRYPLHFHHCAGRPADTNTRPQFRVDGCTAYDTTPISQSRWGITVHNSHDGQISNCVVHNYYGAGIALEDGTETRNHVFGNFVSQIGGNGQRNNDGLGGFGFWMAGAANYVDNNYVCGIAPGTYCYGYIMSAKQSLDTNEMPPPMNPYAPLTKGAPPSQWVRVYKSKQTINSFTNNEAAGCVNGMSLWYIGMDAAHIPYCHAGSIDNLLVWNMGAHGGIGWGFFLYESSNLVLNSPTWRNNPSAGKQQNATNALWSADYYIDSLTVNNPNIQGVFSTGILTPEEMINNTTPLNINGGFIDCATGITIAESGQVGNGIGSGRSKRTNINGVTFGSHWLKAKIHLTYGTNPGRCVTNLDQVYWDNKRIYRYEQVPTFIVPQTIPIGAPGGPMLGSPVAGLTNTQCLAQFGLCVGGEIAPSSAVDGVSQGVYGLVL